MGVFFQRQRQEVLFTSLKTWNTNLGQLFLTKSLLHFPINAMNIFAFSINKLTKQINVFKKEAK